MFDVVLVFQGSRVYQRAKYRTFWMWSASRAPGRQTRDVITS
jgi:hypothetical protein